LIKVTRLGEDGEGDILIDDADPKMLAAYDEKLGQIFKNMKQEKKGTAKEMAKMRLHFKFRVLDLIEIFVKRQPSSPLLFDAVRPLVDAVVACQGEAEKKSLAERMSGILQKICKAREFARPPAIDMSVLQELLAELIKAAKTAQSNVHVTLASGGATFVVKALLAGGTKKLAEEGLASIREAYGAALEDYMTRKNSRLTSRFFTDFIDRQPVAACSICELLMNYGTEARSDFLKAEALRMAAALWKKQALIKDQFNPARQSRLAELVSKCIQGVLEHSWQKAKWFREGLVFAQGALKFIALLGMVVPGAADLAQKASSLAEAENKPSPAVLVGLKTVSNMLMGKDSKGEGRKAKNKRAREANGGEEQVDMTEVEEVGKQKRPKASKSKDTADSKKKGSSPSPKTRKRKSQE